MHTKHRILALLLVTLFIFSLFPAMALAEGGAATITGNGVRLRSGPGTGYDIVGVFYRGDAVFVTGQSGNWYKVSASQGNGYVYASYVSLAQSDDAGTDADASGGVASAAGSLLRRGSTGSAVRTLQGNLILLGYLSGGADGVFGPNTETAVKRYQQRNGLLADGLAGSKTLAAVAAEVTRVNTVLTNAKKYLGLPYLYGGTSPSTGFDCSGFTQYVFAKAGISIPRVSYEQAAAGKAVPSSQLRPGDLVAFYSPVSHVGIYLGDGTFIHSPKTGDVIKITKLSAMKVTAIRRFTGVLAY